MAKQKFLLVNLEDTQAKSLAKVISSQTAKQLLDYLSQKEDASESQIAQDLKLPLSTVHYNIQQMVQANIVEAKHFQYSEKGKKVELYSLANKLIIIAPKQAHVSIMEKLSGILPAALISVAATGLIYYFTRENVAPAFAERAMASAPEALAAMDIAMKSSLAMEAVPQVSSFHFEPLWFLGGAFLVLLFSVVYKILMPVKKQ